MKKCLMFLSLLFSFCFIGNVKADYDYNRFSLNSLSKLAHLSFDNNLANDLMNNYNKMCVFYGSKNGNDYTTTRIMCDFLPSNNYSVQKDSRGFSYNKYSISGIYRIGYDFINNTISTKSNFTENATYYLFYDNNSAYPKINPWKNTEYFLSGFSGGLNLNGGYNDFKSFTVDDNLSFGSYNITFHLNGGVATDFSSDNVIIHEENYQINTDSEELAQYIVNLSMFKENSVFLGWYYDSDFTQAYDGNDNISSDIDLYAKWAYNPNITFHLNGGVIRIYDSESGNSSGSSGGGSSSGGGRHEDQFISEDFTERINYDEISNYIVNTIPTKATMIFEGWYYDSNFKTPYRINDNISSDINLYAKWRYEHADDFLNNTSFNSYTFDTNYNYAIITRGNNAGDVYLGLDINKYDITVYGYDENISNYSNEVGYCLVPIYSKDNKYYYRLNDDKTDYLDVLVLPITVFENNNYNFLLTDNAYITYTNSFESVIIYDDAGNQINTDLSETYQTFQDSLINDEQDLITIFKNLFNFKDNRVLANIVIVWNKLKATELYKYFMVITVGSLIILIIKAAKRS